MGSQVMTCVIFVFGQKHFKKGTRVMVVSFISYSVESNAIKLRMVEVYRKTKPASSSHLGCGYEYIAASSGVMPEMSQVLISSRVLQDSVSINQVNIEHLAIVSSVSKPHSTPVPLIPRLVYGNAVCRVACETYVRIKMEFKLNFWMNNPTYLDIEEAFRYSSLKDGSHLGNQDKEYNKSDHGLRRMMRVDLSQSSTNSIFVEAPDVERKAAFWTFPAPLISQSARLNWSAIPEKFRRHPVRGREDQIFLSFESDVCFSTALFIRIALIVFTSDYKQSASLCSFPRQGFLLSANLFSVL
ncbi:hypothetical protein CEXT_493071 [Caerostris extrusa]|uniref:Uncharacterized protein n=1 Tax=Caerostris extrusa TaxID=172846 RepID=A0AAV4RX96_CAEEX|nr:hypothetical protein CEXT_493071 [Caerostris extrusa]